MAVAASMLTGCNGREHGQKVIPPAEVKTVTHYGVELGPEATPKQVAYVLLRAIRDDIGASRQRDREAKKKAIQVQYELCAPDAVYERARKALGALSPTEGTKRDKIIHRVVEFWAPIAGHYVESFETDWDRVEPKLIEKARSDDTASVTYAVSNPHDGLKATLVISMAKEPKGMPQSYWRVYRVAFAPKRRPAIATATRPAGPSSAPATSPQTASAPTATQPTN